MSGQREAIMAMVGPPTYPAPMQQMFIESDSLWVKIWKNLNLSGKPCFLTGSLGFAAVKSFNFCGAATRSGHLVLNIFFVDYELSYS
tara:strand:- start:3694 stop:3954 length:261 start_codon:yes stop_codon:yes gene_type:complete